jgi:hypothetical protein
MPFYSPVNCGASPAQIPSPPYRRPATEAESRLALFDFTPALLPVSFPGKSSLDPFLFTRLQIERMALDLFNDVFLLHFPFEPPEGVFQCFAVLESYFRQINTPPNRIVSYLPISRPFRTRNRRSIDIIRPDSESQATIASGRAGTRSRSRFLRLKPFKRRQTPKSLNSNEKCTCDIAGRRSG